MTKGGEFVCFPWYIQQIFTYRGGIALLSRKVRESMTLLSCKVWESMTLPSRKVNLTEPGATCV